MPRLGTCSNNEKNMTSHLLYTCFCSLLNIFKRVEHEKRRCVVFFSLMNIVQSGKWIALLRGVYHAQGFGPQRRRNSATVIFRK